MYKILTQRNARLLRTENPKHQPRRCIFSSRFSFIHKTDLFVPM